MHWVDHSRGVALVVTMFLHLMRWLMESFHGYDFTQSGITNPEIGVIRFMEGYLRVGWISAFALSFVISYSPKHQSIKWVLKRFALLIILPTAVFGAFSYMDVGQFNLRWEVIQSLFFYNIISLAIIGQKAVVRYISYAVMIFLTWWGFENAPHLVNTHLFWDILLGTLEQNNYFSIISGLVAYFYMFELFILSYNPKTKTLNLKVFWWTLIPNFGIFLYLGLSGFNTWEPRHYPPQLIEFFGGFVISNITAIVSYNLRNWMTKYNMIAILGRYCWVHFIGHVAIGTLLFDVIGIGRNVFTFWQSFLISVLILVTLWLGNVFVLWLRNKPLLKAPGGS